MLKVLMRFTATQMVSFISLDMAQSLARGVPFLNKFDTYSPTRVAYIYSEGRRGLKNRIKAWRHARSAETTDNLVLLPYSYIINDDDGSELKEIIESCKEAFHGKLPQVLFVDTLAKNMTGDESSTKDMSKLVNRLTQIVTELHMTIILIHHTGLDKTRARGSYSLRCGLDAEIEIIRYGDNLMINNTKSRDVEIQRSVVCSKKVVSLGFNKFNKPMSSLVYSFSHFEDLISNGSNGSNGSNEENNDKNLKIDILILGGLTDQWTEAKTVASNLGLSKNTVNPVLKKLWEAGKIDRQETSINYSKAYQYRKLSL